MAKINSAIFVEEINVCDPDTKQLVKLSIYKHENSGGMFGIDSSFIEQNFEDGETAMIADPFNNNCFVEISEY